MSGSTQRAHAIERLPVPYRRGLQLFDTGHSEAEIAESLGVEVKGVRAMLALAEAKLATLLETGPEEAIEQQHRIGKIDDVKSRPQV